MFINKLNSFQRILCLAPHTDDVECGCGGSIARFIEEKKEVFYVSFSFAKKSIPKGFSKNATLNEIQESGKVLGLKKENMIFNDFEVRTFPSVRQEILEVLIQLNKDIKPDLILLPSSKDTHQDHETIFKEGFSCFKKQTMLGYEIIWNNLDFNTNIFIRLSEKNLNTKIKALECYLSQKIKISGGTEFMRHLAIVRGNQIGVKYAECFEAIRWII